MEKEHENEQVSLLPAENSSEMHERKNRAEMRSKSMRQQTSLNFKKVLHRIMQGDPCTEMTQSLNRTAWKENNVPFSQKVRMNQGEGSAVNTIHSMVQNDMVIIPSQKGIQEDILQKDEILRVSDIQGKSIEVNQIGNMNSNKNGDTFRNDSKKSILIEEKKSNFYGIQQEETKSVHQNGTSNEIRFEYMPKHESARNNHTTMSHSKNKHNTIFLNFRLKNFKEDTLNKAINSLIYGLKVKVCIPSRKYLKEVLLTMSTSAADKLKLIDLKKKVEKRIDVTQIRDIEYGITNEDHQDIRGIDGSRVISLLLTDKEEVECLLQFVNPTERDWFMQGFQHFVKQSHKTQIACGNLFKLRHQIKNWIKSENKLITRQYDFHEVIDILDTKAQLNISRSYLKQVYFQTIKKILDQRLASQNIAYNEYQKILSGKAGTPIPLDNNQFLQLIDKLLDRQELYNLFEKATNLTNIKHIKKTYKLLTMEGFKQFVSFEQKESITLSEIEETYEKILKEEKQIKQSILNSKGQDTLKETNSDSEIIYPSPSPSINKDINQEESCNLRGSKQNSPNVSVDQRFEEQQQLKQQQQQQHVKYSKFKKQDNSLSFHGFAKYIYSKHNSIFNPKKLAIYQVIRILNIHFSYISQKQNMNRPINEYFINCAKNIYQVNFDLLSMTKIAGLNFRHNDRHFPLLYALGRGARYIEIEIWDGENEPVITYGPTMNSKILISEFSEQLISQAFVVNPYPLFLNLVCHCSIKQSFKMKYQFEKILGSSLYHLPTDYKEAQNLPSPNSLKYKIIIIGKLPHEYEGIIQESYTYNDFVKAQQAQTLAAEQISAHPTKSNGNHIQTPTPNSTSQMQTTACPLPNRDFSGPLINQPLINIDNYQGNSVNMSGINNINASIMNNTNSFNNSIYANQLAQSANKSISQYNMMRADGTLFTPIHAFSFHNLPGDSLDQEMLELIIQEEMEEDINVFVAAACLPNKENNSYNMEIISNHHSALNSFQNLQQQSQQQSQQQQSQNIYSTQRRGNPSSVKAIDNFFSKNLDQPKLKKFLQDKYEDTATSLNSSASRQEVKDDIPDESARNTKRGIDSNIRHNPGENMASPKEQQLSVSNQKNSHSYPKNNIKDKKTKSKQVESSSDLEIDEVGELVDKKMQDDAVLMMQQQSSTSSNQGIKTISPKSKPLQFRRESQRFANQSQTGSNASSPSAPQLNSGLFQIMCVRDYGPVHASNAIESIFSFYIQKMKNRKATLWEIFEFSQRDLFMIQEKKIANSVIAPFLNIENFTKKFLTTAKPKCKTSDSTNLNPVPLFQQGISFIQTFLHTFDRYSLVYQSRFHENGAESCGYILKPHHLRNNYQKNPRKSQGKLEELNYFDPNQSSNNNNNNTTKNTYSKISDKVNLNATDIEIEAEDEDDLLKNKAFKNRVLIQIISGYNLSTSNLDRVDPYVELVVVEGDNHVSYKTKPIENNNMNPIWNYDISFTVSQPSICFLIFQCVNSIHGNLLGWFSIPFNCVRQGYRVVPLRDGFLNTIKNSFILCQVTIIRESFQ